MMTPDRLRHHNQKLLTATMRNATTQRLTGTKTLKRYDTPTDPAPATATELTM